jgi:hypothetical protein
LTRNRHSGEVECLVSDLGNSVSIQLTGKQTINSFLPQARPVPLSIFASEGEGLNFSKVENGALQIP